MPSVRAAWAWVWAGFLLVLLWSSGRLLVDKAVSLVEQSSLTATVTIDPNQLFEPLGEMVSGRVAEQPFVATRDGLSEIRVHVATYARRNTASLRFRLLDEQRAVLIEQRIPPTIDERDLVSVRFAPLASAGKRYVIELRSDDGRPGDALTVWTTAKIPSGYLLASDAGRQVHRIMRFEHLYRRPSSAAWLLIRMSQYKAAFVKWPVNAYVLGVHGIAMILGGLWLVLQLKQRNSGGTGA